MNYPFDQLVIIAPILFIVMMILFPLIGVLGGWKRAAYWGGGNFLFYVIGMIIWSTCGAAMSTSIIDLIKGIVGQDFQGDLTKIAASVLAPVFFIGVLLVANLLLLINYYAWFKRVVGLSKYKTVKKKAKDGTVTKMKVQVQNKYSTGYKVMSRVVGGVGMGALMLPTTFAMTNAVFFATTSSGTRATNSLASNIYSITNGTDSTIDWLSYYHNGSDSAADFDALFAALEMMNTKINFHTPDGEGEEPMTIIDALSDTLDQGLGDIYYNTAFNEEAKETIPEYEDMEPEEIVADAYTKLATSWNDLVDQAGWLLPALFNSSNATEIVSQVITSSADTEEYKLNPTIIDKYYRTTEGEEKCLFDVVVDMYSQGQLEPAIEKINVNQKAYDNMVDAITKCYVFDEAAYDDQEQLEEDKQLFRDRMYQLLDILFC